MRSPGRHVIDGGGVRVSSGNTAQVLFSSSDPGSH